MVILVILIVVAGLYGFYRFRSGKEDLLNFIKDNPQQAAILVIRNDTVIARQNIDKVMPLASTVKVMVAIEYAEQAAKGIINPDEEISLNELDKFYVPNTDGDAHSHWLQLVSEKIKDGKISIREIAKGMIRTSSNANTEWLMGKLGLGKINARIDSLGLKNHTKINYLVSDLFVGKEAFPDVRGKALAEKLKNLELNKYIDYTNVIHNKLLSDPEYKNDYGDLNMDVQKVISDNMSASTVADYVSIMQKINSRKYFSEQTHKYLDEIMEFVFEINPANRKVYEHVGFKGGSTSFVLTMCLFATDKKGNRTELAYFMNGLTSSKNKSLQKGINEFHATLLSNDAFRQKIKESLMN